VHDGVRSGGGHPRVSLFSRTAQNPAEVESILRVDEEFSDELSLAD